MKLRPKKQCETTTECHQNCQNQKCQNNNCEYSQHNQSGQLLERETSDIKAINFHIGDLYLFHSTDPDCPSDSSLWGIFDRQQVDTIHTESTSCDLLIFQYSITLPTHYRYARRATRGELRDYIFNLSWFESTSLNKAE